MCGVEVGHGCARGRGFASAHVGLRRSPSRERKTSFPRETHDRNSTADPLPSGNGRGNTGPVGETLQAATDDEPGIQQAEPWTPMKLFVFHPTDDLGSCVEREVRDVRMCRSPRDPRPPSGRSGFEFPLHVPGSGRTHTESQTEANRASRSSRRGPRGPRLNFRLGNHTHQGAGSPGRVSESPPGSGDQSPGSQTMGTVRVIAQGSSPSVPSGFFDTDTSRVAQTPIPWLAG